MKLLLGLGVVGVLTIAMCLVFPPGYLPEWIPVAGVVAVGLGAVCLA